MSQQPPFDPNRPSTPNQSPFQGQPQFQPGQYPPVPQQFQQNTQYPPQGYQQFPQQPGQFQGYPPQGFPQQPAPQPKKKRRGWLIVGIVAAVLVFGCIGSTFLSHNATSPTTTNTTTGSTTTTQLQATVAPTTAPTKAPVQKWTVVETYTGSGEKKTGTITVPDDWKIVWTCNPASFDGGQYNVIVDVDATDGSLGDPGAVNTLCKNGNIGDSTEEHTGGSVYLDIQSEGDWVVKIEELK